MYLIIASFFILLSCSSIVIITMPQMTQNHSDVFNTIKACTVSWFTIEILIRLFAFPSLFVFFSSPLNVIEFFSIFTVFVNIIFPPQILMIHLAYILRIMRVLTLLRIFKHTTSMRTLSDTLRQSRREISFYLFYLFIGMLIFSSAIYLAESKQESTQFTSIPAAAWVNNSRIKFFSSI